ncbi:MAG TPA: hypothetical protein VHY08_00380 [Bacillota bacterium]|nr:hypothetical protein [Bacillota bacterium]
MRVRIIAIGLLLLFCSCWVTMYAKPKNVSPANRELQIVAREDRVGSFKVTSGRLRVIKGKEEDCREDNRFVVAALQQQKAEIAKAEYEVVVKKLVTRYHVKDGKEPLVVYEYLIVGPAEKSNPAYDRLLKQVKTKPISSLAQLYEAPTPCYYLEKQGKLVLLSHYGMPAMYEGFESQALLDWVRKNQRL